MTGYDVLRSDIDLVNWVLTGLYTLTYTLKQNWIYFSKL